MNVTSRWNRTKLKPPAAHDVNFNPILFVLSFPKQATWICKYFVYWEKQQNIHLWIPEFFEGFGIFHGFKPQKYPTFPATARRSWELNWSKPRADYFCPNCQILKPRPGRSKLSDKWINFRPEWQTRQIRANWAYFQCRLNWHLWLPNSRTQLRKQSRRAEKREREAWKVS